MSQEDFEKYYNDAAIQSTLTDLETELIDKSSSHQLAEVGYRVNMHTSLIGDIVRDTKMKLEQVDGQWKIQWEPGMILPELAGGNYLRMDLEIPGRGNIYDRNGIPLAHQIEAAAIGVWPDFVDLTDDQSVKGLLPLLSGLSGVRTDTLLTMIEEAVPGTYLALGEIPADQDPYRLDLFPMEPATTARYNSGL
jgi:penicillin-binding protein 2